MRCLLNLLDWVFCTLFCTLILIGDTLEFQRDKTKFFFVLVHIFSASKVNTEIFCHMPFVFSPNNENIWKKAKILDLLYVIEAHFLQVGNN